MASQELLNYVEAQLKNGFSEPKIRAALSAAGWPEREIKEAFAQIYSQEFLASVSSPEGSFYFIFTKTWSLLKQRFFVLLVIFTLGTFLAVLINVVFLVDIASRSDVSSLLGSSVFPVLFLLFSTLLLSLVTTAAAVFALQDRSLGIIQVYKYALERFLDFLWTAFVGGLIVLAGSLLFLLPGVVLCLLFIFAPFIVAAENLSGLSALLRSANYIRTNFSQAVFPLLFLVLIDASVFFLPKIFERTTGEELFLPAAGIEVILSILLGVFSFVYLFVLYNQLKALYIAKFKERRA